MQIRVSKFEIAAPGMFGRTPFKSDFAKMSISEFSPNKQKFVQNPKISSATSENYNKSDLRTPEFR